MKKLYLSVLAVAAVSTLNAQQMTTEVSPAPKYSHFSDAMKQAPASAVAKATLWTNDCSNQAEWAVSNTSNPAADWVWETDPAAVPAAGPAGMTTAANGYWLIDSDQYGQTGTQDSYLTYTGAAIDLTGQANVTLEFEHNYRTYLDSRSVEVSVDGGATWGTPYVVTDGSETTGQNFDETYSIDISGQAANQANVKIRFHYVAAWGWHWAVDDILIKTTEPFDLRADELLWGVTGWWGATMPYFATPMDQVQPIDFCGSATNIGLNDVTDATFSVDINTGAWTGASDGMMTLTAGGGHDTMCVTTQYTPAASVASMDATFDVSTPGNTETVTSNNSYTGVTFDVTDYLYARDNMAAGITGGSYNAGNGFEVGNIYDIFTAATITGIEFHVHSATEPGASVYGKLYSIDPSTGDFILEDQTDYYTIQAGDLDTPILLPLLSGGFSLTADNAYLIIVGSDGDGGLTNDLVVGYSGYSQPQTTFYYDATDLTWYYTTNASSARMWFGPLGLNEVESNIAMNVFPNPAADNASVSFELNAEAAVNVTVTDLAGKVVYTNNLGSVAGAQQVDINTASMANGVYMVNVDVNGAVSTQKLVVRK